MGINLLVLPLFIKNLGAELYGIWVLSGVVLGYLNVFDFGFTQGLQKYVAEARVKKDDQELSEVVITGVGLLFLIGLLLGGIFWIGAPSIVEFFNIQPESQKVATSLLKISALFCVVMWPLRIVDVVLNASMRIKELSFLNVFKTGAQSVVLLVMVWMGADVVLIKWVTAGLIAGCSAFGLVLLKKHLPEIRWNPTHFKINQLQRMHKFSLGMFYAAVVLMLQSRIDTLILAKTMTVASITSYVIAEKLFQIVQRFSQLITVALAPASFNIAGDARRMGVLIEESIFYRCIVATFLSSIAFFVAPDFIVLWVGAEYEETVVWARVYLCICPFISVASVPQVARAAGGQVRLVNLFISIEMILNVVLSIFLVSKFGVGGPILGTVIAFFVAGPLLTSNFILKRIQVSNVWKVYRLVFPTVLVAFGIIACLDYIPFCFSGTWLGLIIKAMVGTILVGGGLVFRVDQHLKHTSQTGLLRLLFSFFGKKGFFK